MIIVIDGPDGTGKSTLAQAFAKALHGDVIHATYNPNWDMKCYHNSIMSYAMQLNSNGISAIIDRFAPSERVYGNVFRDGESYDTDSMIEYIDDVMGKDIRWIYCRNDKAAENHKKHMTQREEMFSDMTKVAEEFDKYMLEHKDMGWWIFEYDKVDTSEFVKAVITRK